MKCKPKSLILLFINLSLVYCSFDINSIALHTYTTPFQKNKYQNQSFYFGIQKFSSYLLPSAGLQFQPTSNLLMGCIISPQDLNSDLSIYNQTFMGYIPESNIHKLLTNIIYLGFHKDRFKDKNNYKWFSLSLLNSVTYKSIMIDVCYNKLFANSWNSENISFSSSIFFLKKYIIKTGITLVPSQTIKPSPYFSISLNI